MAAVLAEGHDGDRQRRARARDRRPLRMLSEMGARIDGVGTSTLEIEGVERSAPAEHATVPDRIVAGTWAFAAAMTRGDVPSATPAPTTSRSPLDKLVRPAPIVDELDDGFRVRMDRPPSRGRRGDAALPRLPDRPAAAWCIALNAVAEGAAMVTENVFEARFMFVNELVRLGADVRTDGHHAIVRGRERLSGAPVRAADIRAGAGLVLAGLVAEGVTTVTSPPRRPRLRGLRRRPGRPRRRRTRGSTVDLLSSRRVLPQRWSTHAAGAGLVLREDHQPRTCERLRRAWP